ncbi:MAG: hypothetical protein E6K67_07715 [Nitrospirae bacterium]|nr:MAG: hypothetical protein E6K67_07715 [Nitrospirota bacterium]
MRRPVKWIILFVVGIFGIGGPLGLAEAKETFKDEAGRVIYTIDDEGMVSMFESSPTDITLSVTRGTREQMQPSLTEIIPNRVPAGNSATLKLRGKNLVGAKVKLSVPEIELGTYLSSPQIVEVPIHIPANVAPGEVLLTLTTPIGSANSGITITELQLSGNSSKRRDDPKQIITTGAPASCPEGMIGVAAERGGFCIEIDQTFSGDLRKAEKTCAIAGKRLCAKTEWRQACEQAQQGRIPLKNMIGDWEWTGSQVFKEVVGNTMDLRFVLLGESDCTAERQYQPWRSEVISGRCCK